MEIIDNSRIDGYMVAIRSYGADPYRADSLINDILTDYNMKYK